MTHPRPWTFEQFKAAMRAAGWRLKSQTGTYTHKETGKEWQPFNWTAGEGEAWQKWAAKRQTPPPF